MAIGILLFISAAHFLNDTIQSLIPAVLPILKDRYGLTFAEVGLITLTIQMTSSLLQPFVGMATDRQPRPWALPCGMLFTLVGLLMLSRAGTLSFILVSVALIGCGSAIFHPEASRLAQYASAGRRGFAQAIFQVGGNTGSVIGPLAAVTVLIPLGQAGLAWFSLVAGLALLILLRLSVYAKQRTVNVGTTAVPAPLSRRAAWVFTLLFVLMFSKQVYVASLTNFFTFFVMDRFGATLAEAQYSLFAFLAAGAVGTVFGGPLTDRFGRRRVIFASIVGSFPFALMLPWCSSALYAALCSAAASFVISSAFSAILVCAFDAAPGRTGLVSGVFFGLSFGLGGVAGAALGWLADVFSLQTVFVAASFLPALGVTALLLPKETA